MIICWFYTIWYTFTSIFSGNFIPIDGHDYYEKSKFSSGDRVYLILECKRCKRNEIVQE
jgi:hypothetical protein